MWLSFSDRLAPNAGIGVALTTGIGGSATPEYSFIDTQDIREGGSGDMAVFVKDTDNC